MAVPPILGSSYLKKLHKNIGGKLKKLSRPLIAGGIGDKMDKGNLWIVPGFTLLVFACLWTTKLSKIALEESTCRGASIYDFTGTPLDQDAQRHCQTARRYYVAPDEPFLMDQKWREDREVKNPEWILWFWAPIVFVMYVITRFLWTLLLDNQGINFPNVVNAAESVTEENDGICEINEERLQERLGIIAENFRCATSSRAFAAFIAFEFSLVIAPLCLLLFVLPLMIGPAYRSWGLDVVRAWWERRDWQGVPLQTALALHPSLSHRPHVPLIPRITYCDYNFVSIGNSHTLTYRCYLDANWHERTALFIWIMLVFLTFVNFINLFFWVEWVLRMKFRLPRKRWVLRKWLNNDEDFSPSEQAQMGKFAEGFRTGNLLLFYYIEAHTSRVVASAFCQALFRRWLEKRRLQAIRRRESDGGGSSNDSVSPIYRTPKSKEPIVGWVDPESGTVPSPSEYYSPPEAESPASPETVAMSVYSPHRYSASSDSASSKPEVKFMPGVVSLPPEPISGETPRTAGTRPFYPRREKESGGGNYKKNLKEASREPLMPFGSGAKLRSAGSGLMGGGSAKERRRLEKELQKEQDRRRRGGITGPGAGTPTSPEQTGTTGGGGSSMSRRCAIM